MVVFSLQEYDIESEHNVLMTHIQLYLAGLEVEQFKRFTVGAKNDES